MLKIGDFSRLSRVTIKALRYYDELGLLKPARIDPFTGYRYYSADQLAHLHRIIALKDMGLSLEEIARMLQDDIPVTHILDLLHTKQETIKRKLEVEAERLKRIEDWIQEAEAQNDLPSYEIILKEVPLMQVVAVQTTLPNTLVPEPVYGRALTIMKALIDYVEKSGAQVAGPPLGIYYDDDTEVEEYDCELAIPVSEKIPSSGEIHYREIQGYDQVLTTIHKGGINSGAPANIALAKWFDANDYRIIGPRREIYMIDYKISGPERKIIFNDTESKKPPLEFIVEIQIPIGKS